MSKRDRALGAALALLVFASWWLARTGAPQRTVAGGSEERTADYFVTDFSTKVFDETGKLERLLSAAEMRHFPDDNSTELDRPRVTLYSDGGSEWLVEATAGRLSDDGGVLRLSGGVELTRQGEGRQRPVRIETEHLLVYPEKSEAETGAEVRVSSGDNWMHSDGMRAWFGDAGRIRLLSNVRGRYEIH